MIKFVLVLIILVTMYLTLLATVCKVSWGETCLLCIMN